MSMSDGAAAITVALGPRSYDIAIGEGLLASAGTRIAPLLKRPKTAIVTDTNVARAHLAVLERSLAAADISSTAIVLPPEKRPKVSRIWPSSAMPSSREESNATTRSSRWAAG